MPFRCKNLDKGTKVSITKTAISMHMALISERHVQGAFVGIPQDSRKMRCVPERFLYFFYNELEFRAYIKYNISTKRW